MHGVDSLDVLAGKFDGDYEQEFPQCDHKEPIPPPVVRVDRSLLDHSHMMLFDTGEDSNNIAWNAPEWRDSSWNATAAAPAPWKNTASSYSSSSNPSTLHRIPPTTTTPPSITITTTPTPTLRTSPSRRSAAFILREREQRSHLIKQATRMVNRIISSSSSCSSSSGTASATDPSSSFTDGVSSSWFQ